MDTAGLDVDAIPDAVRRLLLALFGVSVLLVRNGELPAQDDMGREAGVGVRWVIFVVVRNQWSTRIRTRECRVSLSLTSIGRVGPGKDVGEAPRANFGFGFFP